MLTMYVIWRQYYLCRRSCGNLENRQWFVSPRCFLNLNQKPPNSGRFCLLIDSASCFYRKVRSIHYPPLKTWNRATLSVLNLKLLNIKMAADAGNWYWLEYIRRVALKLKCLFNEYRTTVKRNTIRTWDDSNLIIKYSITIIHFFMTHSWRNESWIR